jgi:ankyrin repeat protein
LLIVVAAPVIRSQQIQRLDHEETPLHWAAEHGMTGIAQRLIANGAEVDALDHFGRTPLHLGVAYADIVQLLIDEGADVDAVDLFLRTPLHRALQYPDSVAVLLANGADIDAQDYLGDTPLERTLRYGTRRRNLVVIDMLLSAGAAAAR